MGSRAGRSADRWITRVKIAALAVALTAATGAALDGAGRDAGRGTSDLLHRSETLTASPGITGPLREERLTGPDRVVVRDDGGVVATFTVGARTVTVRGPQRTFAEPGTTSATVTTTAWVRLLPAAFDGVVDHGWLADRLTDTSEDVLALAAQYTTGAPDRTDAAGLRIAGDASYGPLLADGTREEGSDFNDFLGVPWTYAGTVDRPETRQIGSLDCSGYVRMAYGYRAGVPLTLEDDGVRLPRRAVQMAASAPGVMVIPHTGSRPAGTGDLAAGDLVFFDASTDDGTLVDHVGIYLGTDSVGAPRFVSSRKGADGPTMGDVRGRSTLSGTGLYATAFRAARRL